MKKILLIVLTSVFGVANAQTEVVQPESSVNTTVAQTDNAIDYESLTEKPDYPGGRKAFSKFFKKNFNVDTSGLNGKTVAVFIIEKDGSLTDIHIVEHFNYEVDQALTSLLESMPKWIPGKIDGKPIRTKFTFPLTFETK